MNTLNKHPRVEIYDGIAFFRCQATGELVSHRIGLPAFLVLHRTVAESELNDIYGAFADWNVLYSWLNENNKNKNIPDDIYQQSVEWMESTIGTKQFGTLQPAPKTTQPGVKHEEKSYIRQIHPFFGTAAEEYAIQQRLKDQKKAKKKEAFDLRGHLLRKGLNNIRSYCVTAFPDLDAVHVEEVDVDGGMGLEWMCQITGAELQPTVMANEGEVCVSSHPPNWNKRHQALLKRLKTPPKIKKPRVKKTKVNYTEPPFPVLAQN